MWTLGVPASLDGMPESLYVLTVDSSSLSYRKGVSGHQSKSLFNRKCIPRALKSPSCGISNLGLWRVNVGGKTKVYKDFD